jgi:ketosteroid isomerase-like protein
VVESSRRYGSGDLEGVAELYAPDAVGYAMEGWPEKGPFLGRDAVVRQYRRLQEDWEDQSIEVKRTASSGDWVAVEWLWGVRGRCGAGGQLPVRALI